MRTVVVSSAFDVLCHNKCGERDFGNSKRFRRLGGLVGLNRRIEMALDPLGKEATTG